MHSPIEWCLRKEKQDHVKHGQIYAWLLHYQYILWGTCLQTTIYLLNISPSMFISKTSLSCGIGISPILDSRIWGCLEYVLKSKIDKKELRCEVCIFTGYPKGTRGYYFHNPQEKKVQMQPFWRINIEKNMKKRVRFFWKKILV